MMLSRSSTYTNQVPTSPCINADHGSLVYTCAVNRAITKLLMSTGINADRKIFNERNFETEKNKFTIEIQLKVEANYKSN